MEQSVPKRCVLRNDRTVGGGGARQPSQAGQHFTVDSQAGEAWGAMRAEPFMYSADLNSTVQYTYIIHVYLFIDAIDALLFYCPFAVVITQNSPLWN